MKRETYDGNNQELRDSENHKSRDSEQEDTPFPLSSCPGGKDKSPLS